MEIREAQLKSRVLYPNPVCLLVTQDDSKVNGQNIMVCSWLTPVDNRGHFILSINKKRYSIASIPKGFTLYIPTKPIEDLVLSIGCCSGRDVDKFMLFPRLQYSEVEGKVQMLNDCAARLDISVLCHEKLLEAWETIYSYFIYYSSVSNFSWDENIRLCQCYRSTLFK